MNDGAPPSAVLLDTCAVIWVADGDSISPSAHAALIRAGLAGGIFVSPISAWEAGLSGKSRPGRNPALRFLPDPATWFARFMSGPGIKEAAFTPGIAVAASCLPGDLHGDPGDRIIIATARHLGVPIVTRDSNIVAYAGMGHVGVVVC